MAHERCNLNVVFNIHRTGASNRLEIVLLSEGEARLAVVWALPGNPYGTGVSGVLNNKGQRGCARRGPLAPGRRRAAREGEMVEGATLYLSETAFAQIIA